MPHPGARPPRPPAGAAAAPREIVAFLYAWPVGLGASPFSGLFDLYRLQRLPLADATGAPRGSVFYDVDRRIPGATQARPDKRTFTS